MPAFSNLTEISGIISWIFQLKAERDCATLESVSLPLVALYSSTITSFAILVSEWCAQLLSSVFCYRTVSKHERESE